MEKIETRLRIGLKFIILEAKTREAWILFSVALDFTNSSPMLSNILGLKVRYSSNDHTSHTLHEIA